MKTLALLATLLPLVLSAAENPPIPEAKSWRELLQQGLFEEEANRDLEKAAAAYEILASQYDAQRALAATALYRLAEIRARQGRQAAAVALYQRVLTEFPASEPLAKLSRERLTAAGAALPGAAASASTAPTQEEADELARMREVAKNSPDLLNSAQDELPLNRAALHGWLEVARFLLDHGAKADGIPRVQPPIFTAAAAGRKAVVELLLDRGAKFEKTPSENSPLVAACGNGHAELARLLLERGADANTANARGYTALHAATAADRIDLVQLLLEYGANPNVESRLAARNSASAGIPTLPRQSRPGRLAFGTPLEMAASAGSEPLVKLLLAYHADPNYRDEEDEGSALMQAVQHRQIKVAELLIDGGAKVDFVSKAGFTPLAAAVGKPWDPALVRLLLDHSAPPTFCTSAGETLLHLSLRNCVSGQQLPSDEAAKLREVWEALLAKGVDVNAPDQNGRSVLHLAMGWNESPVDMVGWLIEHGADPTLADKRRALPVEFTDGSRRFEIEKRYTFPKLVDPKAVTVVFRTRGGTADPFLLAADSETPPVLGVAVQQALLPLTRPRQGDELASRGQGFSWPSEFDAVVLRAKDQKGSLEEVARFPFITAEHPEGAAWPGLLWGDIVVLLNEGTVNRLDPISSHRAWIEGLGSKPATGKVGDAPFLIRAVAGVDSADAEDFTLNRGKIMQSVRLERATLLDRSALQAASIGHTGEGKPTLLLTFTPEGARELGNVTKLYLGKQLGVIIAGQLLATPMVREAITGGSLEITGELDEARARQLVEQLNAAIAQGDFVTAPGHRDFLFAGTALSIDVRIQKGGFLSWSVDSSNHAAGSGPDSKIAPDSGWFILPESADRVWVYKGAGPLLRVDFNSPAIKFTDVAAGSPEFGAVPKLVARRYLDAQKPAAHP